MSVSRYICLIASLSLFVTQLSSKFYLYASQPSSGWRQGSGSLGKAACAAPVIGNRDGACIYIDKRFEVSDAIALPPQNWQIWRCMVLAEVFGSHIPASIEAFTTYAYFLRGPPFC